VPAKFLACAGTVVHYLHTGPTTLPDVAPTLDRGELFVLLASAGGTAGMWRRQLDGLAGRHSAVALDFPGHGRAPGVEGLPTIAAYADCLVRFAEALRLRPFVLVGRCMGGAVALVAAHERPDLVRGLVLVCAAARFALPEATIATVRDIARGRLPQQFTTETFAPDTAHEIMREAWAEEVRTDPRVRLGDLLACRAFDGRELLAGIRVPTLVVAGAHDRVTPLAQSEELARGIRGARLAVLPEAGHHAPLEESAAFNRLLAEFAEGLG
jgi:pimeloyl-ACP methyl ester carboxylesterase